jgi:hypothetical protein
MNTNDIAKALNAVIESAQAEAMVSSVYYGVAASEINGHHVYLTAVPVFGGRKTTFRKCWQIDGKRCKAADLIARVAA